MDGFELLREKSNIAQTPNTAPAIIDDTFSHFIVFFGLGICKGLLIWRFVLSFEIMLVVGVRLVAVILAAAGFRRRQERKVPASTCPSSNNMFARRLCRRLMLNRFLCHKRLIMSGLISPPIERHKKN